MLAVLAVTQTKSEKLEGWTDHFCGTEISKLNLPEKLFNETLLNELERFLESVKD